MANEVEKAPFSPAPLLDKDKFHLELDRRTQKFLDDGTPLALIFMDVSCLKHINDTLGHSEGDRVLSSVKEIITGQFRKPSDLRSHSEDFIASRPMSDEIKTFSGEILEFNVASARIGGDEFTVLCETDDKGALSIARRIRSSFDTFVSLPENSNLREAGVELAMGVGVMQPGMSASQLLALADREMYEDKESAIRDLSPQEQVEFAKVIELLENLQIRHRDVGKYAIKLGYSRREIQNLAE